MRTDKRGRQIGYNWWRELIVSSWVAADLCWLSKREEVACGYATENKEFAEQNPRPTLKQFMIGLATPNKEL